MLINPLNIFLLKKKCHSVRFANNDNKVFRFHPQDDTLWQAQLQNPNFDVYLMR